MSGNVRELSRRAHLAVEIIICVIMINVRFEVCVLLDISYFIYMLDY